MKQTKTILIQGSSRSHGDTRIISDFLVKKYGWDFIDLAQKKIGHYDYEYKNSEDDFHSTAKEILEYDRLIFITPVYWYTMSGIMKAFFDRISDLIRIDKDTGRRFRGKQMAAISSCNSPDKYEGFFMPFKLSAEYLGVTYLGDINVWVNDEDQSISEEVKILLENFEKEQLKGK